MKLKLQAARWQMLQVQAWISVTATEMQCRIEGLTEATAVYASAEEERVATAAVPAAGAPAAPPAGAPPAADVPARAAAPAAAAVPED